MRSHPEEDSLEEYILGQLDEPQTREVELHLGGCEPCGRRLKEVRDYVRAMQAALADLPSEEPLAFPAPRSSPQTLIFTQHVARRPKAKPRDTSEAASLEGESGTTE
jgi:anti-sigma factor RsiW